MDVTTVKKETTVSSNTLRKGALRTSDAVAQSIALLSLVMGIALSTSYAARAAGAAAPLAYIVAGLGSLCLAYIIIRFTRRIANAGGIYTYISQGLGPMVGFVGGWMYAGAFAIGISFTLAISSAFLSALFADIKVTVDWFPIFCALVVVLFLFAFFDIRISTRAQLVLAALGVLSVLVLVGIILAVGGDSGLSLVPFSPSALPNGPSGLFFATVFSFTSFIGFEAAAVLGEETSNPRHAIPRAILTAIIIGAIFYILVVYTMSIGYGVTHAATWAKDLAPLDTLANRYSNTFLATFIDFMVAVGAFIASLAGLNLTSRMLFAMGRDGGLPAVFSRTHARYKTPWVGVLTALIITLVLGVTLGRSLGAFTFFGFLATTASLAILFAYILVALSGMVFFQRAQKSDDSTAETTGSPKDRSVLVKICDIVLPIIAILLCGATIYSTVIPTPDPPLNIALYLVTGWLVLGLIVLGILWIRDAERVRHFGKLLGE